MARIIITLFCFFFSLLSHQTMSQPQHMETYCNPNETFTRTSSYETNRNILLSSLSITSSLVTYSNATIGLSPDTVHGMFLCRGDLNATTCSICVQTATLEIATKCTLNKEAFIYYDECMVRYSSVSFFSKLEVRPNVIRFSSQSAPNPNGFNQTLSDKFNQTILSVSSSSLVPYYVLDLEHVTQLEGSYDLLSLVQCSPDLDRLSCVACLRFAFIRVSTCCGLPSGSFIFTPKCLLVYLTAVSSTPPPPSPLSPPPLFPPSPPSPLPLFPPSPPSPPPLFLPPQTPSQAQPPPLAFTPPRNVPSSSGSFSSNILKGNEVFGSIVVTITALVFALVDI